MPAEPQRRCPFDDCSKPITAGRFSCGPCLFRLKYAQRETITQAEQAYRDGTLSRDKLYRTFQAVLDVVQPRNLFRPTEETARD